MGAKRQKGVVAVSGGVDSAVAAKLLREQGYELVGLFMRQGFPNAGDEEAARKICRDLRIDFYPVDVANEFQKQVIDYFISEYACGRTPNPCIKCNKVIKFCELLRIARDLGGDFLATGHYARIIREGSGEYGLYRGKDPDKDQTYFLYRLKQAELAHVRFPLGEYTKDRIVQLARQAGLPNNRGESQDICFLKNEGKLIDHNEFLRKHLKLTSGPIRQLLPEKKDGERLSTEVGRHAGLPLYTIGQRKGVNIGGIGPFYVAGKDLENNILYVVKDQNDPMLLSDQAVLQEVNWISGQLPELPLECEGVIRYRHPPVKVRVLACEQCGCCRVRFIQSQRAVTSGQSLVFYQKDKVIGGGVVS